MKVRPLGMLLRMRAGGINRYQQDALTYHKEENRVLREKLGIEPLRIRVSPVPDQVLLPAAQRSDARRQNL